MLGFSFQGNMFFKGELIAKIWIIPVSKTMDDFCKLCTCWSAKTQRLMSLKMSGFC